MAKISAVIITYNEERKLKDCILSLIPITEDIIVVDSGSTDSTTHIAKELGVKVLQTDFAGYGANRNLGADAASNDWVLAIDGDEVLSPRLVKSILMSQLKENTVYAFNSLVNYGGRWVKHCGWYPQYKQRLYNKKERSWDNAPVHEDLTKISSTSIVNLEGILYHYSIIDDQHLREKSFNYGVLKAKSWRLNQRKINLLTKHLYPAWVFLHTYIIKKGFLDGNAGFNIAINKAIEYKIAIRHFFNKTTS